MAIVRAPRPNSNFYLLDKSISEDRRLSWAARGLLIFLLGKPDYWKINISNLIDQTKCSFKPCGRDGVYSLLKELVDTGYVIKSQDNNPSSGRFGKVDYVVRECCDEPKPLPAQPETAKTETESPLTAEPLTAEPLTANPTLISIEYKQELKESKDSVINSVAAAPSSKQKISVDDILSSYGITGDLADDFKSNRKKLKADINKTVMEGFAREAAKAGISIQEAVRISTENSWKGFRATWNWNGSTAPGSLVSKTGQQSSSQQHVYIPSVFSPNYAGGNGDVINGTCEVMA